ncbi:hypothetical protein [Natronobacterium texcoconense]|uniref:Uncharacterized protein n=1 Tax=Natronobacterium texcoconense TaxID=1095778 RepID=A0A1H1I4N9_NATTX|nr:hypothetical protein [Natronobacterium texcoconense]SDR32316.1 hypothetical protein SAMN04489842_3296 [Natronobacterium texcoconense]
MSNDKGPLQTFFEAERRFHAMVPIKDLYSKLLFRTLLWFLFFWFLYMAVTGLL